MGRLSILSLRFCLVLIICLLGPIFQRMLVSLIGFWPDVMVTSGCLPGSCFLLVRVCKASSFSGIAVQSDMWCPG